MRLNPGGTVGPGGAEVKLRPAARETGPLLCKARTDLNRLVEELRKEYPDLTPRGVDLPAVLELIPGGGCLVAPLATSAGSALFVIPAGIQEIGAGQVLWLPGFADQTVLEILAGPPEHEGFGGWAGAYFSRRSRTMPSELPPWIDAWQETILSTGSLLWQQIIPLAACRQAWPPLYFLPEHEATSLEAVARFFLDEFIEHDELRGMVLVDAGDRPIAILTRRVITNSQAGTRGLNDRREHRSASACQGAVDDYPLRQSPCSRHW